MAERKAIPDSPADDAALQLKKRARRRLVGAVALALLAAIVLPMVMDHEPRPAQQDIQIRIPSQDGDALSARVLNKPAPAPLPKPKTEKPADPVPAPAAPAEPARAEEQKAPEKPAESKPADVARAEKALAGEDSKPASRPEAKAEAKAEPKPDSKSEQWVLQLGAYQDQGNVKTLQAKIKELGYPSYTEKVTTPQGDRIRVRAGPFASKAAAEKAQAALKRVGAGGPPGGVVAPK